MKNGHKWCGIIGKQACLLLDEFKTKLPVALSGRGISSVTRKKWQN